jgi:hypothetical protein
MQEAAFHPSSSIGQRALPAAVAAPKPAFQKLCAKAHYQLSSHEKA